MEWLPAFVRNFILGNALQHTEYGAAIILIALVSLVWIGLVPWVARRPGSVRWLRMPRENIIGVVLTAALIVGGPRLLETIGLSVSHAPALACPPSQLTYSGGEPLVIEAGSAATVRFSRTHYNPPGTTPAIAAWVGVVRNYLVVHRRNRAAR